MISRDQAERARDYALNAQAAVNDHTATCRKCAQQSIPCELGGMLRRGALRIQREARDALAAYLPPGSQVVYHGQQETYRGSTFVVMGPSRNAPYSAYTLSSVDVAPFVATLPSLHLTSREAQQREQLGKVKRAVALCLAVAAKYEVNIKVNVDRSDTGIVRVVWSSAEFIGAEVRAQQDSAKKSGQYLAAALYLLQALRAHTQRREWHEVERDAHSAQRLAERAQVSV
ncbi:hypothetical protein [Nonomuraea sediminis]|uniref:hypothetical protein n=1 Tax=Nonomuraea sediminis TaxID=2835864 RepID=UPI001BDCF9C1|nr:hypothetical protein [Nonomuraea sediminis]